MKEKLNRRISTLLRILKENEISIAIITSWPNIFYLTGLHIYWNTPLPYALIVSAEGNILFVCSHHYGKMMEKEYPQYKSIPFSEDHLIWPHRTIFEAIKDGIKELHSLGSTLKIGIEERKIPAIYTKEIIELIPEAYIVAIDSKIDALRYVKDEDEIESIKEAALITNKVAKDVIYSHIKPGISEYELERIFVRTMAENGVSSAFCRPAILSGERSCYLNVCATDRKIRSGDTILMDFGVRCKSGYCSDISRVAVIGKPSIAQDKISKRVKEIILDTIEYIRPGRTASDIDGFVNRKTKHFGYEDKNYRTGHNIGLEGDEPFRISEINKDDIIKTNMCIAIEPGLYIDGVGVRLEDNIIITDKVNINLTSSLQYEIISV